MISSVDIIARLLLGALFGGIIGYERQVHGRPAGLRTHLIVSVASVLVMIISEYFYHLSYMNPEYIRIDPGRIAAGAITGIGFLGAGVILKTGVTVQGLTTAACLWMVSAIGLSLGSGLYLAATVSFGLTLFALMVLRTVERRMPTVMFKTLRITTVEDAQEETISSELGRQGATIHNIDYEKDVEKGEVKYRINIALTYRVSMKDILDGLSSIRGVKNIVIKS
jgi:putative Mg2+ transporter-C (MgtC) family protein